MPGASVYPTSLDNFAEASPTNLGDNDTTGRNHAERHDDIEAAVEALQARVGVTVGTFAEASPTYLGTDDTSGRTHSERHNDIATAVLALQAAVGFTAGTFATTSPTNLGDDDSSGRTHSERHNDIEDAVEALQAFVGVTPTADVPVMLAGAALYLDAEYHEGSETVFNRGSGGYALNALNGGGTAITSNDPKWLPYEGTPYVYLPGVSGNYLSTPDAAALDITGDIDIRVKVALDDWTPSAAQVLLAKRTFASSALAAYEFFILTTGILRFQWYDSGTAGFRTVDATAATGLTDGAVKWCRATLDADNGAGGNDVKFWLSDDGTTWTQLGTTVTTATVAAIQATASAVEVGSRDSGASGPAAGKFYRAIIKSGIDGTTVLDVDTSVLTSGAATSFTERSSNAATVTINRATSGRKSVAVVGNCWLLGTDDYLEVADNALLDFGASDDFTVLAVVRQWGTWSAAFERIVSKASNVDDGWTLNDSNTSYSIYAAIDQGANRALRSGLSTASAGALAAKGFVVDRSAQTIATFSGGTLSATASTAAVGSIVNALPMRIGADAVGTSYNNMELVAVAVFRSALTAAQISAISTYFASR